MGEQLRSKGHLLVDFSLLKHNIDELRKRAPSSQILFMVKANAYGHGMFQTVDSCSRHFGIDAFGVSSLGEALALRRSTRNYDYELYVFSDLGLKDGLENYLDFKLIPVLSRMDDLSNVLGNEKCRHLPLVLKVETGMNRLGIERAAIADAIDELRKRRRSVYHLMSHFSDDDLPEREKAKRQYRRFLEIKAAFREAGVEVEKTSMANSQAIENGMALDETTLRPGRMLYGIPSTLALKRDWEMKPISSLKAEVLDRRLISKGDEVGYASTPSPREGKLCILGIGYGDGITHHYQSLPIRFKNFQGQILGRINMDMIQALFPKEAPIEVGDLIPIWPHSTRRLIEVINHTKFISYEVLCLLSDRIPRVYVHPSP